MANEGSTKPTYSELEAENLRVRGLLQRQWISVEERLPTQCGNYLTAGTMFTDETIGKHVAELSWDGSEWRELRDLLPMSTFGSIVTHWRELPEPPSGAESADIGKLDTADKSGVEMRKVNSAPHSSMAEPFPYKGQVAGSSPVAATILNELVSAIVTYLVEMSADNLDVLDKAVDKSQAWLMAGGAETGGEKAAEEKCGRLADPPNLDDCTFHIHLKKRVCDDEEGTAYVAHILELDIVAVDPEPWRALEKLALLVNRQIDFALKNKNEGAIWFPAPKKYFDEAGANFRRSSQNQTVSSGVERAHEGTTADEKGESREPAKLNNAQNWCPECCTESGKTEYGECANNFHNSPAESSLSSPPPTSDSSAPTTPAPLSTQLDTHTEKI